MRIALSRTDSIGDVMLTLPMAGFIKKHLPADIFFVGKSYTEDIILSCEEVDSFINWDSFSNRTESENIAYLKSLQLDTIVFVFPNYELAKLCKKAGVNTRIGVNRRLKHFFYCNKLVSFTRKGSDLHESQLNFKLLSPLIKNVQASLDTIHTFTTFTPKASLPEYLLSELSSTKKKVVLHCKSQGSAREWGIANFNQLAQELSKNGFQVILTGTKTEGELIKNDGGIIGDDILDTTGQLSLKELITLISKADHLVAASTGPLHIAAALGIHAIGLYTDIKPIHPGRWQPIGKNVTVITEKISETKDPNVLLDIPVKTVFDSISI